MSPYRKPRTKAVATLMILLFVPALTPATVLAQSLNGSLYVAQGAPVAEIFAFSVSGGAFVAIILTFGMGGHGRWFAAVGTTDGVSGTGQILNPTGFAVPTGGSMQFQLDGPGAPGGSFTTTGLEGLLSLTSGRFVRVFP